MDIIISFATFLIMFDFTFHSQWFCQSVKGQDKNTSPRNLLYTLKKYLSCPSTDSKIVCPAPNLLCHTKIYLDIVHIQWAKVSGLYFKNWLFGPDLAQIWPNLVHIKACKDWHHVSSALEVLMTFKNLLRLKIYSLRGQK